MTRSTLLDDLIKRTESVKQEVLQFSDVPVEMLNQRKAPDSWSALECLEHLNRYGRFYVPEIETRINSAKVSENEEYKSGWLGNYFALSMLPGENGKLNKMKTFKSMNPLLQVLNKDVIDEFVQQQDRLLNLLQSARRVDLAKVKTGISISKWIKLQLGDTFRVVVYHNQRHVVQARKALPQLAHN
ncbi:MAG: DinB family protein [Cyclobacteriaceae bacterium]